MRIISGIAKGKNLLAPKDKNTRPTQDSVKEAVFNILSPLKDDFIALDLFAATGSIGLEFLSRAAKHVYFSEKNNSNIDLLKRNLQACYFTNRATVLKGDFRKNLKLIDKEIDYVYIDPPYQSSFYEDSFSIIQDISLFDGALLITEVDRDVDFSQSFARYERVFHRRYGQKYISIYERN